MNKYSNIALDVASNSSMNTRHGAVLVKSGKIITTGTNHHKCHLSNNKLSVHAEIDAIQRLIKG